MRREGYEFALSRPQVITKEIDGKLCEPIELLVVDVPEESMGTVIEKLGSRRAEMQDMTNAGERPRPNRVPHSDARPLRVPERIPDGHAADRASSRTCSTRTSPGRATSRPAGRGAMIVLEPGETTAYSLEGLEERGSLFVAPGVPTYSAR